VKYGNRVVEKKAIKIEKRNEDDSKKITI